jgi:type II secretory pathway component PulC
VWKLIDSLKNIIYRRTTLIESTEAEIQEVKHDHIVLQEQNEKLHEEVKALRAQRPDEDLNCVRISTQ